MKKTIRAAWILGAAFAAGGAGAVPVFTDFTAAGADPASITATRDAFRVAVGGGSTAGANGAFGAPTVLRREINWDGVPAGFSDPNPLPANFFNVNSPRGVVFSTPGTGFLVSSNAGGAAPTLFGFPADSQTFSPQKLFAPVNSNIVDVNFFEPGTATAAVTTAFAVIFVDVETANATRVDLFDTHDVLIHSLDAPVAGNQGLSFVGATVSGGSIGRVRITSGLNALVSNGVRANELVDYVVMDDFLFAEPARAVPEPASAALMTAGAAAALWWGRRRRRTTA